MRTFRVQHGRRLDVHGIGAGAGFGQRERRHQIAVHAPRQIPVDLGLRAEVDERQRADALVCEHGGRQTAEIRAGLAHPGDRQQTQFEPTERFGHLRHEKTEVGGLLEQGTDDVDVTTVDLVEHRLHLLLGELLDRAHQEPLVIAHVLGADDVFRFDLVDEEAGTTLLRQHGHAGLLTVRDGAVGRRGSCVARHGPLVPRGAGRSPRVAEEKG